jgi:hypothetical protein
MAIRMKNLPVMVNEIDRILWAVLKHFVAERKPERAENRHVICMNKGE